MQRIPLLTLASLAAVALVLLLAGPGSDTRTSAAGGDSAGAAAVKNLSGCGNNTLPANDDDSTGLVTLPFTLNFFGTTFNGAFVNNNGNITFPGPPDDPRYGPLGVFTPFNLLTTERVIIAPFFADVDTLGLGSGLVTYGNTTFAGNAAFCVNWLNVGYFSSSTDKLNSFQLLLVARPDLTPGDFDMIFNYNQVQWETGDASGGVDGLGGFSARAGYSNGVDTALELPGSAVNGAFLDSSASGLALNSRGSLVTGRYIFAVRSGVAPTGGTISGTVFAKTSEPASALEGAFVQVCEAGGFCNTTPTNAVGQYTVTGLADGQYRATAFPPGSSNLLPGTIGPLTVSGGATLAGQDIVLENPTPPPPGTTITSISTTKDGVPVIFWSDPIQLETTNCPGGAASYQVVQDGTVVRSGPMTEGPAGTYTATIAPLQPLSGDMEVRITIDCPDPTPDKAVEFNIYIDPSGTVLDQSDNPVSGATVTLYRSDSASGPFEIVPDQSAAMSPSNRTNPDTTDADGRFAWDVIAGYYIVRASAPGCVDPENASIAYVETNVLTIPPPALDLELRVQCGGGPGPTATPPGGARSGDVNCNDLVDSVDALLVLQYNASLVGGLPCLSVADVNEDGSVTAIDAVLILQYAASLIDNLPV